MAFEDYLKKIPVNKEYDKSPYSDRDEEAFFKFMRDINRKQPQHR